MSHENLTLLLLALPFTGSVVAMLLPANARNAEAWLAGGITIVALIVAVTGYGVVQRGDTTRVAFPWIPGVDFGLRVDGYAWMFTLIVTGIGFLVVLYARYYMSQQDPVPRFYSFLLAFMGAMLGVVVAGNLILIVFFWELTSLFSFLLIGYWHHIPAARDGARISLIVTSAGGLCLLAGMLIIGHIVGSYDLDRVLRAGDAIRMHPLYLPALGLIAIGAFTKSAQFPFHFWLPNAMAAPTPVSAYLHSASMVMLGLFLLARLWPVMAGTDAWLWIVGTTGLVTFVYGGYAAIFQNDLKGLLAYSTISHLGLITLLLGLDSPLATVAAIFHMVNHATFKASLFMATGVIDHEAGTRDIRRLSGLARSMPITATLAMVAAAAMAGVPLLNGFLSKEMFFAESLHVEGPLPWLDRALPYVAAIASTFTVAYSVRFIHGTFFGPDPVNLPRTPHEAPRWMRLPIEVLAVACVLVGILPAATIGPLLRVAVRSVLGPDTPEYSLVVWHGFDLPLLMSTFALAGGVLLYYALRDRLARGHGEPLLLPRIDGRRIFDRVLVAISWRYARALQGWLETRRLQPQLRLLVVLALAAAAWPMYRGGLRVAPAAAPLEPALIAAWIVGGACAIAAAWQAKVHRFAALLLAAGSGLVTCVTFVWFSAPDLALTQLAVEIVTTVLLLLGLRWLPKPAPYRRTLAGARAALPRRLRDLVLALAAGSGLAAIAYAVMTRSVPDPISHFFVANALPKGGGTNVVNVILVDFRGFDTLGEITVLGAVAVTVFSLLRRFRPARESMEPLPQQQRQSAQASADDLLVPGVIMRALFGPIIVLGLYLLLRGHDLPGGGFVAGIVFAIGLVLQYMAGGTRFVEDRLRVRPVLLLGIGLALAGTTGAGAWLFGYPFLTSHVANFELPPFGEVHLPSAMLFDVGVFLLVIGATTLILVALAHQSLRVPRGPAGMAPGGGPRGHPTPEREARRVAR